MAVLIWFLFTMMVLLILSQFAFTGCAKLVPIHIHVAVLIWSVFACIPHPQLYYLDPLIAHCILGSTNLGFKIPTKNQRTHATGLRGIADAAQVCCGWKACTGRHASVRLKPCRGGISARTPDVPSLQRFLMVTAFPAITRLKPAKRFSNEV